MVIFNFHRLLLRRDLKKKGELSKKEKKFKDIWQRIKSRLPRRIAGIAVYVVPIYILVYILNVMGMFQLLRETLSDFVVTTFMPMESLSVIILSFAAEFTSGFAAAGALLEAGVLTIKQTVLALLIGNILAFPVRAIRHQLPRYIGIFSPKMGTQLLLLGQGFRITSLVVVGISVTRRSLRWRWLRCFRSWRLPECTDLVIRWETVGDCIKLDTGTRFGVGCQVSTVGT